MLFSPLPAHWGGRRVYLTAAANATGTVGRTSAPGTEAAIMGGLASCCFHTSSGIRVLGALCARSTWLGSLSGSQLFSYPSLLEEGGSSEDCGILIYETLCGTICNSLHVICSAKKCSATKKFFLERGTFLWQIHQFCSATDACTCGHSPFIAI